MVNRRPNVCARLRLQDACWPNAAGRRPTTRDRRKSTRSCLSTQCESYGKLQMGNGHTRGVFAGKLSGFAVAQAERCVR